ncbi:hypothetical protein D3C87_2160710 [compost metagenome]
MPAARRIDDQVLCLGELGQIKLALRHVVLAAHDGEEPVLAHGAGMHSALDHG